MIGAAVSGETARYAQALSLALVTVFVLLLVFLIGSFVIVRSTRRYRAAIERKRSAPTESSDVWSLARVNENQDDHESDEDEREKS